MKKHKIIIIIILLVSSILINVSNLDIFPDNQIYHNDNSNNIENTINLETSSSDCHPVKFEWVRYWSSLSDHDRCFGSFMDSDDNIYLTGYQNFGSGDLRLVLVKYDKDGNLLFTSNWGTSGNDQHTGYDVVLDSLGNIYCAGIWRKDPDDWNEDFILIKFDSLGNHIWSRQWGGGGKEKCYAVACDSQDNLYLTGSTTDYGGEVVTLKYDSSGNLIWTRYWGGSYHESGFDLTIDSSDNIYVAGYTYTTYASNDMVVIKYDSDGNRLLNFTWGTPNVDWGRTLAFDSENNFYLAGQADNQVCLIKYNSTLDYQWNTTLGGSGDPRCIAFDSNNDIYVGGFTSGFGAYYSDFYLLKFDNSGNFHYRQLRNQAVDYAYAVHINSNDDIYLTGSTYSSTTYSRMMMIKYTEPPCIAIISPEPYSIYNNTAPGFNISIYEPHLDTSWYSLNNGHNYTFSGSIGTINQIAWELCEDGTITLRFFANDSIGKMGSNLIYLWKDSNYPESTTPYLICWDDNGVPISTEEQRQYDVHICSDGKGGAIMAWQDDRRWSEQDIYVQKVNATGDVQWTIDGLVICYMTYSDKAYDPEICPDGKGGAIVTWRDYRDSGSGVYAQKIDSDGNVKWTQNGVAIRIASSLWEPKICSDGKGGALITWQDSDTDRIYAQHINSEGLLQWGSSGIAISSVSAYYLYEMCSDQKGGFIISWITQGGDIYAQKLSSSGSRLWGSNGVPICLKPDNSYYPKICHDGNGGAIITWFHGPYYESERDIYVQRVNSTGVVQWEIDGLPICTIPSPQTYPQIIYDGDDGAIITWEDSRNGNTDIYAQRVSANGEFLWVIDGFPICNAQGTQNQAQICSDGENGAFIVWTDRRNGNADIYAQRVGPIGYGLWKSNGVSICNETGNQDWVQICNYSNNGAIIVWQDTRNSVYYDLYVQKIRKDIPEIFIKKPLPFELCGKTAPDYELYIEEYNINHTWYSLNDGINYTFTGDSGKINQEAWDACGNGTVSITFYVNNSDGKLGKKHIVVRKDIIDPSLTILSPIEYELFGNSTINFEISIEEPNLDTTWYILNGGPSYFFTGSSGTISQEAWDACGNGTVTIHFYANDLVGNWAFKEVIVRKNTHFPNIVIYSPVENQICGIATIEYELSIDDPKLDTAWYTLNGGPSYFFTGFSGTISQEAWDACGNGTVTICFYANNTVGNTIFEELIVRKNLYSPYIDIISPVSNQLFGNISIDFELTIDEPNLDITWYTLNGGASYFFTGLTGTISREALDACGTNFISIIFYANNTAGNIAFEEVNIQRDIISPEITILSPMPFQLFGNKTIDFELTIDEPNLDITWYTLNGGASYFFTGLTGTISQEAWDACGNGTVTIRFYANDSVGNWAFKELIIRKDIYEPLITIHSPAPFQLFSNNTIDFELTIDEPNLDITWYTLNGGASYFFTGLTGTISQEAWDACGNGTMTIRFYANDSVGNWAFKELIIRKDIYEPLITIHSPVPFQLFGNKTIDYELTIDESNLDTIWYKLNGSSSYFFTGLTGTISQEAWDACGNGIILIRFYANDSVGNIGYEEITVVKDTIPPDITILYPIADSTYGNNPPQYSVSIQDPHLDLMWYTIDMGLNNYTFSTNGTINFNAWNLKPNGLILLTFYANDSLGNIDSQFINIIKQAYPEIFINLPPENGLFGFNAPAFNVEVYDISVDTMWYSIDNGLTNFTFFNNDTINQGAWDLQLSGLITLTFFVNNTEGDIFQESIIVEKDVDAPQISIITPIQDEVLEIPPAYEMTITEANLDKIWYTFDGGTNKIFITELIGVMDLTLWNQLPNGYVTIRFYANDTLGNISFDEVIVIKDIPTTNPPPEGIPGYNVIILLGMISLIAVFIIKRIAKEI